MDKATAIQSLQKKTCFFESLPPHFQKDDDIIRVAIQYDFTILGHVDAYYRSDRDAVLENIRIIGAGALWELEDDLRDDLTIFIRAVLSDKSPYPEKNWDYLGRDLALRCKMVCRAVEHYGIEIMLYSMQEILHDRNVAIIMLENDGMNLRYNLAYMPKEFRADRELVKTAVRMSAGGFEFIDEHLKNDREFVKELLSINGLCLHECNENIKACREMVSVAMNNNPRALVAASGHLQKDPEFIQLYYLCLREDEKTITQEEFSLLPEVFKKDEKVLSKFYC